MINYTTLTSRFVLNLTKNFVEDASRGVYSGCMANTEQAVRAVKIQ